ncbi:hypothetical protein RchiOBHm_Chr5g0026481 [Rosa chinensis]|uniref:Uncharacterized protein n=1 Tax=Rosa chinensis TaxID=74649 RepID=A0A2P6Q8V7_ROSCH|nr:hypothetical protein RchiOBHm_Chr5g0026481 [Rosa chinensis]
MVPRHQYELRRMGSNGAKHIPMSEQMDGSKPTVEIKIKTLDHKPILSKCIKRIYKQDTWVGVKEKRGEKVKKNIMKKKQKF